MLGRWEHFEEGSRIGVRGYGETEAEAFEQAALGMTAAAADPGLVWQTDEISLEQRASDPDRLLYAWLEALAGEGRRRGMLFSRFKVRIEGEHLSARAWGEPLDRERHALRRRLLGVAAPTALLPRVARHGEGWIAQALLESKLDVDQAAPRGDE